MSLRRLVAVAALAAATLLGPGLGVAGAQQAIGPDQHFVGFVNGSNVDPVVTVVCAGPIYPGRTGPVAGGQTISVPAPIDTIPLFVRAGSIIPLGAQIESTQQPQAIEKVLVYPGADGSFTLFSDDGTTYAYEKGAGSITHLHWDDARKRFSHDGAQAWTGPDKDFVRIVGR